MRTELSRMRAKSCREKPVACGWNPTALQVSQHGYAYVVPHSAGGQFLTDSLAGSAQPRRATRPSGLDLARRSSERASSLSDDDDGEPEPERLALTNLGEDPPRVVRNLRDEDGVRAARDPRAKRDPTRVASHDFDDHDPLVGLRGRVESVDGTRRRLDRRVEADRLLGAADIAVDRFWNGNAPNPELGQMFGDVHRTVAAREDERIDAQVTQANLQLSRRIESHGARREGERVDAARTKNAAAPREDASHIFDAQRNDLLAAEQPLESESTGYDEDRTMGRRVNERTNCRITARSVAASREQANTKRPTRCFHSRLLWHGALGVPRRFDAPRTIARAS